MAIVDSLSQPANGATFDANADFHIICTWTVQDFTQLIVGFRYDASNDQVQLQSRTDNDDLVLEYNDGSWHTVATVTDYFTGLQGTEVSVDIYGNGSNVKVDVDGVEQINETVTHNATSAGGGIISHSQSSNDIELESWPYGEPSASTELVIADASLALSADGSGSVDGLWDLGAYIHAFGSGIILEVSGVDVLLAIASASLALSSESPALGPALSIANASLALSSENVVFQSSVSIDANRIARIIFVMKNG